MAILSPTPKFQGFDASGDPLTGGLLYTYEAGTTTPLATYTDYDAGTPNANPVVLDSRGEADVWLDPDLLYKMVLKTSAGVTVWTVDDVGYDSTGFIAAGAGAVRKTSQSKLRERVSLFDYMTAAQVADVIANTATVDVSTPFVTAMTALATAGGGTLVMPFGTYLVSCPSTATWDGSGNMNYTCLIKDNVTIEGNGSTIKLADSVTTAGAPLNTSIFFSNVENSNVTFRDIIFDMNGANNSVNGENRPNAAITWSSDGAFCNDLLIEHCQFLNGVGVTSITFSQTDTVDQAVGFRNTVRDCFFYYTNAYLTITDHSTISGHVNDCLVTGCTFKFSAVRDGDTPTDEIGVVWDLAGTNNRFIGNLVQNYGTGVQVAGNFSSITEDTIVANNVFSSMRNYGVNIWQELATEKANRNIIIANNHIELEDTAGSIQFKVGIQAFTTYSCTGIYIFGNSIKKTGIVTDAVGVYAGPNLAGQKWDNVVIKGNIIDGCYAGIWAQGSVGNWGYCEISDNTIRNCVNQGAQTTTVGIQVNLTNTTFDEIVITNNKLMNDAALMTLGITLSNSGGSFDTIVCGGNYFKNVGAIYTETAIVENGTTRYGSEALGNFSAAPTTGTWTKKQHVINQTPSASNEPGWVCITSGTFGTATDSTGDTDGSTAVITGMTDTSDFAIGSFVTASAGFAVLTDLLVVAKTATTLTVSRASNSVQTNITVSTDDPVFKAMASLAA